MELQYTILCLDDTSLPFSFDQRNARAFLYRTSHLTPNPNPYTTLLPSPFHPSRAILHHAHDPAVVPPLAHLEPALPVARRAGRVRGRDALERGGAAVADAGGEGRVAAGVDAGVAAREGDVGVAEEGEGDVAVVEAAGQVAELDAVVAGVAVGEPGDVLAAVFWWVVGG